MSRSLATYSAMTAKVKAMYGKRLRGSDFRNMAALSDVAAVMDYLRQCPGWSEAVDRVERSAFDSAGQLLRIPLERALRDQARSEYVRLLHFLPRADQALTAFPILLSDARSIMIALRRLHAGHIKESAPLPQQYVKHSRADHEALRSCTDFEGLLAATQGTIYYEPLRRLRPVESGVLPDYTTAEALLKTAYYAHIYRVIHKNYAGQTRDILLKIFGREIDMLNILHVLRLKRFFPEEQEYFSTLFPFHYKLKPQTLHALCAAPDMDAARRLVEETPYGPDFRNLDLRQMEVEYRRLIYRFNRRQLSLGVPSVYTAVAYLNLKDQELKALINVIESVYYGIPYIDSFFDLIGD